jgi:Ca2+-binding RTX toxin-like protein
MPILNLTDFLTAPPADPSPVPETIATSSNGSSVSVHATSFVNESGAGGMSTVTATSPTGETSHSHEEIFTPGATSSSASGSGSASTGSLPVTSATANTPGQTNTNLTQTAIAVPPIDSQIKPIAVVIPVVTLPNSGSSVNTTGAGSIAVVTATDNGQTTSNSATPDSTATSSSAAGAASTSIGSPPVTSATADTPAPTQPDSTLETTSTPSISSQGTPIPVEIPVVTLPNSGSLVDTTGTVVTATDNGQTTSNSATAFDTAISTSTSGAADASTGDTPASTESPLNAIQGLPEDDNLSGTENGDLISGDRGNDQIQGFDGSDRLDGEAGDDSLQGGVGNDSLNGGIGNDQMWGLDDSDRIFGEADDDFLCGNKGDDVLDGGDGNDSLWGGKENDWLNGGSGDDYLSGDFGVDTLTGGNGADTFTLRIQTVNPIADLGFADAIADFNQAEGDQIAIIGDISLTSLVLETIDFNGDGQINNTINPTTGADATLIKLGSNLNDGILAIVLGTVNAQGATTLSISDFMSG